MGQHCGRTRLAKAFVVAAPASGSGKTVVTLGLLRAFRNKGLRVASAKVGPDYIDPRFHERATGRPCFNVDPWAMDAGLIRSLLTDLAREADLIIIEGVMGLFDGPKGAAGSTADLAATLGLPVVLAVDARRQSQSIAALVHGFATWQRDVEVAGAILNRVSSDRHAGMLSEALGDRCLGLVRQTDSLALPSRHLGLVQAEEHQGLEGFIESCASAVTRETDLDKLFEIAAQLPDESVVPANLAPLGQHIAVAADEAFAFAYPHLLHQWRRAGAEVMPFSPLADEAPAADADAVFMPGGYPELHAGRLAANGRFLAGLQETNGLVYGECGGFMVLGEAIITSDGTRHAMAGLLPLATSFASPRLHLGYRQLAPLADVPWSGTLRGHEFHYSTVVMEKGADPLFAARDAAGNALGPMGMRRGNVMGSYAHVIARAP
jgi:cobyrinic acid a,c-diamide synthase